MKISDLNHIFNQSNRSGLKNKGDAPAQPAINSPGFDSYSSGYGQVGAKVLNDKLAQALGLEQPKQQSKPLFDFEEVVKNVLQFVTGAVKKAKADGANDDKLQEMLAQAREGVQTGIDDAYGELEDAGLLNDEIKTGIEQSQKGIEEGLNEFEQSLFGEQSIGNGVAVSQAQYMQLQNNAEYRFTTAEGDEVVVSLAQNYQAGAAASLFAPGEKQGSGYASEQFEKQELNFTLSVNGELNEDEQQAVNDFMAQLQGVSEDFFSGQYDEAFNKASELQLDNPELVAFSMDLTQTKTRAAIREYERTAPGKEVAKELQPFNESLKEAYKQAGDLGLQNELSGLMLWLNQDKEQEKVQEFIDYSKAMFSQLEQLLKDSPSTPSDDSE
ncbi:DUF5610 domain-containing protein [Pseudoalteromonas sp. MM17-2]|uniref:DUF5610 domain-containing protein n=1 Tax=Pseudoalteromonas sp. MM17-2 TaxID=2917753 RepID=UPI001EF5D2E1|nr:DUF5610 domain-containing protein [Pseudoalteromonas sp. MM17-2]MCG7544762.1 DUF5610 domain-containing protein [Pseudoalteromonas sp. MM17-2]